MFRAQQHAAVAAPRIQPPPRRLGVRGPEGSAAGAPAVLPHGHKKAPVVEGGREEGASLGMAGSSSHCRDDSPCFRANLHMPAFTSAFSSPSPPPLNYPPHLRCFRGGLTSLCSCGAQQLAVQHLPKCSITHPLFRRGARLAEPCRSRGREGEQAGPPPRSPTATPLRITVMG